MDTQRTSLGNRSRRFPRNLGAAGSSPSCDIMEDLYTFYDFLPMFSLFVLPLCIFNLIFFFSLTQLLAFCFSLGIFLSVVSFYVSKLNIFYSFFPSYKFSSLCFFSKFAYLCFFMNVFCSTNFPLYVFFSPNRPRHVISGFSEEKNEKSSTWSIIVSAIRRGYCTIRGQGSFLKIQRHKTVPPSMLLL